MTYRILLILCLVLLLNMGLKAMDSACSSTEVDRLYDVLRESYRKTSNDILFYDEIVDSIFSPKMISIETVQEIFENDTVVVYFSNGYPIIPGFEYPLIQIRNRNKIYTLKKIPSEVVREYSVSLCIPQKEFEKKDPWAYIEKNGYKDRNTINDVDFRIRYFICGYDDKSECQDLINEGYTKKKHGIYERNNFPSNTDGKEIWNKCIRDIRLHVAEQPCVEIGSEFDYSFSDLVDGYIIDWHFPIPKYVTSKVTFWGYYGNEVNELVRIIRHPDSTFSYDSNKWNYERDPNTIYD